MFCGDGKGLLVVKCVKMCQFGKGRILKSSFEAYKQFRNILCLGFIVRKCVDNNVARCAE